MDADSVANRDKLEAEADVLRSRLGRTLRTLAQRWRDALNVRRQTRRHLIPVSIIGAGLAGSVGISVYRSRYRQQRLWTDRLRAVTRLWKHPNRVARTTARTLGAKIVRRVAVVMTAYVVIRLAGGALAMIIPQLRHKALDRQP